jgi:hypothetical protein
MVRIDEIMFKRLGQSVLVDLVVRLKAWPEALRPGGLVVTSVTRKAIEDSADRH